MSDNTQAIKDQAIKVFGWHNLTPPIYRYIILVVVVQGPIIAYQTLTKTKIEDMHVVLENGAAITSIITMIYGTVLFLYGCRQTLIYTFDCFGLAISPPAGTKTALNPRQKYRFNRGQRALITAMPLGLLICHFALSCFVYLFASLVINAPFLTP